ncbi:hypothetical protein QJQ45_012671 [Haematococcus lacustris]|nr:hypothetical protein QJQ45_012671 [Haematococcus lacustris]
MGLRIQQRIGESRWRPLELCYRPEQGALPAKGKEYPGLGYKRLRDKPPKAQQQQQQQQPAVAHPQPLCPGAGLPYTIMLLPQAAHPMAPFLLVAAREAEVCQRHCGVDIVDEIRATAVRQLQPDRLLQPVSSNEHRSKFAD